MMRSMFAGVSGLRSHQLMMDVVGNNIANVNTAGYKSSRVVFQDTLSQVIRGGAAGDTAGSAGVNPQQVGLGVRIGATDLVFTQGASQLTGRATDVAIQGDGFFIVKFGGEQLYTRAGSFSFDNNGFLTDPTGAIVQGWMADPTTNTVTTNGPVNAIQVQLDKVFPPIATSNVNLGGNLASATLPTDPPVTTNIEVIDSLGQRHAMNFQFQKTVNPNEWALTIPDPLNPTGPALAGPVTVTFDATGHLPAPPATGGTTTLTFTPPGADPMNLTVDFSNTTQFGQASNPIAINQDGVEAGSVRSLAISDDGTVTGVFSNGKSQQLAKLALAIFNNPAGLVKAGQSLFRNSGASGDAAIGQAATGGRGSLAAGTLEMSNVDLAQEFTNLIIAQRGFQANSRIISASDEILQDLVNLKR